MKIKDIMVSDVVSVNPRASVSRVAEILFDNRFHALPVTENGRLVGIVTEDDFFLKNYADLYLPSYLRFLEEKGRHANLPEEIREKIEKLLGMKAKDIMTAGCVVAKPEMEVQELMKIISETKFTTFPVTGEEQRIIGIVTLSDILGTVRNGAVEMHRAFRGKFKNQEAEKLAAEIDLLWKEKMLLVSRKHVRTWKGILFIALLSAVGLVLLSYAAFLSRKSCGGSDQPDFYPLECQRFRYSAWSACNAEGVQTRTVIEKLPARCTGGAPELVQNCP